ncbi:Hypothetical protein NTJ_04415 [Nesidiocoris tenuis]|uniref:Uncharacterized protein n=1 Tax=Nesidiocoris tenuis TaxID=355587 RepID=A0ABN7AK00_9HEMI|nr:Hypothetical protein NTJ_04415 [Nesidiocoris tenuis]
MAGNSPRKRIMWIVWGKCLAQDVKETAENRDVYGSEDDSTYEPGGRMNDKILKAVSDLVGGCKRLAWRPEQLGEG